MDVDQDAAKGGYSVLLRSAMNGGVPKNCTQGDDKRLLPTNTPIDMEKPLPAEAAILIPRAVATQAEAEEAERTEPKEKTCGDPKVEVKQEKGSGDDAPGDSRGSADKQRRERKSRWDHEVPAKESTKREASKRPDDVDSRPGAAAREASGDDLHSALGRSASKAMAKKPEGSEVRLRSAGRAAASPVEPGGRSFQDATGCFYGGCVPGDVIR